ncbi:MAG TPA: hypothetical protein VF211_01205 [Burkholderiales bacterium]
MDTLAPSSSGRFLAYGGEPMPLSEYWVQAGAMVDSNILRRTEGSPTETVGRVGVGGRKDTYIYGRQMLRLEGRLDGYLYNRFDDLSNVGYGASGEWHWALGGDLSGVLGISRRRYQRDLAQLQRATRDMITETRYLANAAYAIGPSLRVRGALDRVDFDTSASDLELRTTGGLLGVDYVTPLGNYVGLEYRRANGDAPISERIDPLGVFVDNSFEEQTVALRTGYIGAFLRLTGDIGRTRRTYSDLPGRDFEGTTWRVRADWLVTAKTVLGFETYRRPASIIDIATSHVVARGVAFGPGWAPTAKLNFSARIMRERQEFSGDPGTALAPDVFPLRLEIIRNVRLGAYWEYTRQIHWQFAIDHGSRESNVLDRDFDYNAFIANVRYLFW